MTTASQAPLKLPPTFASSFWPSHPAYPSYRSAITHLFTLLQHGLDENASILAYIERLVQVQWDLVDSLRRTTDKVSSAIHKEKPIFRGARDEDAAAAPNANPSDLARPVRRHLLVNALQSAAVEPVAAAHVRVTQQLTRSVLEPFGEWTTMHGERVRESWRIVEEWLDAFEQGQDDLDKLRHTYEFKCRQADEAEDDARFSGVDVNTDEDWDTTTASAHTPSQLTASSSSGTIVEKDDSTLAESPSQQPTDTSSEEKLDPVKLERRKTLRKQFGFSPRVTSGGSADFSNQRSVSGSSDKSHTHEDESGLKRSGTISAALSSALSAPAVQAIRDRLAAAAGAGGIAEKWRRLRREADKLETEYLTKARSVDTLRCRLEDALSEQLSALQKYEVDRLVAVKTVIQSYSSAFNTLNPSLASRLQPLLQSHEPNTLIAQLITSARTGPYRPQTEIFHPFYHDEWSHAGNNSAHPAVGYGTGWAGFGMHLNAKWRAEVLSKHNDDANHASMLENAAAVDGSSVAKPSVPVALPLALSHLLSSLERAYKDASLWPIPTDASDTTAARTSANAEKRKSWTYEVPLKAAHACRSAIISHVLFSSQPGAELGAGLPALLDKFDPPTKAMTVKVFLAELQEGLVPEENWHIISSLYKAAESVEAKWRADKKEKRDGKTKESQEESAATPTDTNSPTNAAAASEGLRVELDDEIRATIRKGVLDDLAVVLGKLSSPHLVVLDSVISHLKHLVSSTSDAGESDEVYVNKLALSLGRFMLRPPNVTHSSMSSPIPVLLLMDLVTYYEELVPPALNRKSKQEEEAQVAKRRMPTRKRTKPIDTRIRRSQIGVGSGVDRAPPVPEMPRVPPKIITDGVGSTALETASPVDAVAADTSDTPTPIAERMLSGHAPPETTTSSSSVDAGTTLAAPVAPTSASDAGGSSGGSAYGTPPDETDSKRLGENSVGATEADEGDDTIESIKKSSPPLSATTTTAVAPAPALPYDEDRPLSNVARLSRQFGSASSGTGSGGGGVSRSTSGNAVRGPRPAGARASGSGGVSALANRLQQQQQSKE